MRSPSRGEQNQPLVLPWNLGFHKGTTGRNPPVVEASVSLTPSALPALRHHRRGFLRKRFFECVPHAGTRAGAENGRPSRRPSLGDAVTRPRSAHGRENRQRRRPANGSARSRSSHHRPTSRPQPRPRVSRRSPRRVIRAYGSVVLTVASSASSARAEASSASPACPRLVASSAPAALSAPSAPSRRPHRCRVRLVCSCGSVVRLARLSASSRHPRRLHCPHPPRRRVGCGTSDKVTHGLIRGLLRPLAREDRTGRQGDREARGSSHLFRPGTSWALPERFAFCSQKRVSLATCARRSTRCPRRADCMSSLSQSVAAALRTPRSPQNCALPAALRAPRSTAHSPQHCQGVAPVGVHREDALGDPGGRICNGQFCSRR